MSKCRLLLIVFFVVLLGLTANTVWLAGRNTAPSDTSGTLETAAPAAIGGAFTLTNAAGQSVSDASFRGRMMLVFFGFTQCPDVCPTTLGTYARVLTLLGADASHIAPIFITLDPAHDTPAVLAEYMKAFPPAITALTGTQAEIDAVVQAYKVYSARQNQDETGAINHSGYIYLMGTDGHYLTHFSQEDSAEHIVQTIRMQP